MNNFPLTIEPIPYEISNQTIFERIRHLRRPVFLDSNADFNNIGFDIIAAAPCMTITTSGKTTTVASFDQSTATQTCPFSVLKEQLKSYAPCANDKLLPFTGGAIGFFSYDLGRLISQLPTTAVRDIDLPEMDIGIYLWAIIRDHANRKLYFIARPECAELDCHEILTLILTNLDRSNTACFKLLEPFKSNTSAEKYAESYAKILEYIYAGDCYQINFSQRFDAPYEGDPWQAYLMQRAHTDAPFSAFLQTKDYALLSLSPERFILVRDNQVETKPIKGTRPRGVLPQQDQLYVQLLRNSSKDQAENLMIVDLMRNDISRNCILGSVTVPELFAIESYSNVHHLVSTIRGNLKPGRDAADLLRDSFPGGSITGAPKRRAMEIIEELEPQRRSAYCGSIGYLDFNGNMDTNIAIRTLVCHNQRIYCWGGGGIVAGSDVDNEYQESYIKVSNLLNVLQSNGVVK